MDYTQPADLRGAPWDVWISHQNLGCWELWFDGGLEPSPSVSQSVKWVQPLFPQIGGNKAESGIRLSQ